jgi:hypothetical protein
MIDVAIEVPSFGESTTAEKNISRYVPSANYAGDCCVINDFGRPQRRS